MADREYGTAGKAARVTTANTTPQAFFQLTHKPAANATYLYLLDVWADLDSRGVGAVVDVDDGTTLYCQQRWRPDGGEQGGVRSLGHAFLVSYGASPPAQTFTVRHYLTATGATLGVRQGRLTYLRLGANDRSASGPPASPATGAATWTPRQTLTLAAGEYLLVASASVAMLTGATATPGADVRASAGATTHFGDCSPFRAQTPGAANYVGWRTALDYTAAAGDVFSVDYAAEAGSGATAGVRDVALCALWVPDLPALYKSEQTAEISTSATTPQVANTLAFTAAAADHLLLETAYPRQTVTGATQLAEEVALTKGGAAYDQPTVAGQIAGFGPAHQHHGRATIEVLPAGAVSYATTYRATGGNLTAYVKGRRLYAIQLTATRGAYQGVGVEAGVAPAVAGLGGLLYRVAGAEAVAAPDAAGDATVGRAQGVGGVQGVGVAVAGDSSIQRINTAALTVAVAVSGSSTVAAAAVSGRGALALWSDQATRARGARPVNFVQADFGAAGVVYLWTGYGDFAWNGVTWHGGGDLLTLGDPKESVGRERNGVTVRLASRDQFQVRNHLVEALAADIHGNKARVYLGWLLDDGSLAGDPVPEFDGELSAIQIGGQEDGGLYIDVTADHETRDLDRGQRYRITAASQTTIDPNDKGLEYLADMANIKIEWGTRYYNRVPSGS